MHNSLGPNDEMSIFGYWVQQGGSRLVPATPGLGRYVLPPDFSGYSILVEHIDGKISIYNVTGGQQHLAPAYNVSVHPHGMELAASLMLDDYVKHHNPRTYTFLKYKDNRWNKLSKTRWSGGYINK